MLTPVVILLAVAVLAAGAWIWRLRRAVAAHSGRWRRESEQRGEAESRVRWATDHDVYTDLPRLHHFIEHVDEWLSRAAPESLSSQAVVAVKLADLDRTIATFGHEAGLEAARELVRRLRSLEVDAYGQSRDVFLLFGSKARLDSRLRRAAASPSDSPALRGLPGPLLFAGSAASGPECSQAIELVRRAEAALGLALRRHEPWVEYCSSMDPDAADLALVRQFRRHGGEALRAVFQPQLDLRTGEIVGAEALARWQAARYGPVDPERFIPLLEEAGLIREVTRRMISEASRVASARRGRACPISVNVTISDLLADGTRRYIFESLRAHGASPQDIKLELTETSFAENPETVRWVMSRLRDAGFRVSIDDFGTGFSSLSYLSDLPVDELKIDQSFISGIAYKDRNRSIVRATIAMAHELGLVVVAEGVENEDAMRILREDACDRAQGYLIARPLGEAQFLDFVAEHDDGSPRLHKG